jgi:hypothetical protein
MKKIIILLAIFIVLGIAWYALSPLLRNKTANDSSPLQSISAPSPKTETLVVKDQLSSMDDKTKQDYEKQVAAMANDKMPKNETMPGSAVLLSKGDLIRNAHDVQGQALIIQQGNSKILRFENLKTINGPNVHIYLATDLSNKDFVDLGSLKATDGNVNYNIPSGTNTEKYNKALIWCKDFNVLFSYAELKTP